MPSGPGRRGVLRRRDRPHEGARAGRGGPGRRCGRRFLHLPDRLELPTGFRGGRRLPPAHAVRAGRVVRRRDEAPQALRLGPGLFDAARPRGVFVMCGGAGAVVFRGGRLVRLGGRVCAVGRGPFRRGQSLHAAHVGAGRGGDGAAPAAQHERPGETEIKQPSRHGFHFTKLINTRGRPCPREGRGACRNVRNDDKPCSRVQSQRRP